MRLNNFLLLCDDGYVDVTISYIGADGEIKYCDYAGVVDIPKMILNSKVEGWAIGSNGIVIRVDYTE